MSVWTTVKPAMQTSVKPAMQTSVKKADTIAQVILDVGVDSGENVGADGDVAGSEDGGGANRTGDVAGGDVDDSEDGDGANRADDGAGDGTAHRCGRR